MTQENFNSKHDDNSSKDIVINTPVEQAQIVTSGTLHQQPNSQVIEG